MLARLSSDTSVGKKVMGPGSWNEEQESRFKKRYLPFPQPMSKPTEPGGRVLRKRSMMGQGCDLGYHQPLKALI
ncbi:hypothetical protein KC367_g34 [Hortaea werneckii]|nr:hypothetical protein KC367_g34 [Hortaea werneckii]